MLFQGRQKESPSGALWSFLVLCVFLVKLQEDHFAGWCVYHEGHVSSHGSAQEGLRCLTSCLKGPFSDFMILIVS